MTTPVAADERFLAETPKPGRDRRSAAARDRARVLHSAGLRRLAGKTQVVGPGEHAEITGVPRTRLTHSLEVGQIGRDLALDLGLDPDVVDAAGLAHDIGHPPFGHNGERALDAAAAGCGGFEGNAQTLRLLTRLEPSSLDDTGDASERCRGLNLTRAVLDACVKYPWARRGPGTKFGVYDGPADGDAAIFAWVRAGVPAGRERARCVEAQVMDWADDVAYSVHDVEDAVLAGRMSLAGLAADAERAELVELAALATTPGAPGTGELGTRELGAAGERLAALPAVTAAAAQPEHSLAATVALKRLTSVLVGRFAAAAVETTLPDPGGALAPGHGSDLTVPAAARAEVAVLKAAAMRYVMREPARLAQQARERALLTELVERLEHAALAAPTSLDPALRPAWEAAGDDAGRRRVVVDQVAVLTDAQALAWCGRLRADGASSPAARDTATSGAGGAGAG